jgi:hypothetical protein
VMCKCACVLCLEFRVFTCGKDAMEEGNL